MNEHRTVTNSDTDSAQARSLTVPPLPFDPTAARDFIYTERNVVGRLTTLGRHYSKFGEQIENFLKAQSQDQVDLLAVQMIATHKAIKRLARVRVAAPSLPKGEL